MLYNEDIKYQYIEYLMSQGLKTDQAIYISQVQSLFNIVAKEEEKLQKDVGEFSKEEIIQAFMSGKKRSARTLYTYCNKIRKYCLWYNQFILKNNQDVDWNIGLSEAKELVSKDVKQEGEYNLQLYSKDLIDRLIDMQINPVQKLILCATYYGISGNRYAQITTLKSSSVTDDHKLKLYDWINNQLQVDRTISVSEQILFYLQESCDTYTFKVPNPEDPGKILSEFSLTGPYAIKSSNDTEVKVEDIDIEWLGRKTQVIVNRMEKLIYPVGFEEKINLKKVYLSGFINTLKAEASILQISVSQLFSTPQIHPILLQYGKHRQKIDQVKFSIKEYL